MELESALTQIRRVWQEKTGSGSSVSLERLPQSVTQIFTMLNTTIARRDPSASLATAGDGSEAGKGSDGLDASQADAAAASGGVNSSAQAAGALAAAARYFSRSEPSNPALLLVRQATELLGKSFLEVMRILVPDHVEKAAINIGRSESFDVPIERLSNLAAETAEQPTNVADSGTPSELLFEAQTRAQALALLEQVGSYFRTAEPSSPIPFLTERARDLAQRDFLSVLKALLPPDSLKTGGNGG
jgi:type VI secretion system protein ImpA